MLTKMVFRADINGLRAWAVLAVLGFHFYDELFAGGFIGVDVFFVISGYLMTGIIMRGLISDSFSFVTFCLARARRIFPALWCLVAVLLAVGWFWLPTVEYQSLGEQVAASLLFLSNIYFWTEGGYFDTAAVEKPLLHTWSLSAEWQFYMLLPLFLWLLWQWRPSTRWAMYGLGALCSVSLLVSIVLTPLMPTSSYYLLPTRGWEMVAGGLVYLLGEHQQPSVFMSRVCQWLAWAMLTFSLFLFSGSLMWPGGWALLPVLATVLLLWVNNNNNPLIANAVAQWLGNRSYSIYLWHWPFVMALDFVGVEQHLGWIGFCVVSSIIMGDLSYRWIEQPYRRLLARGRYRHQVAVMLSALVMVGVMAFVVQQKTFTGRLPSEVELIATASQVTNPRQQECFVAAGEHGSPSCVYGDLDTIGAVVIGDSHADTLIHSVGEVAQKHEQGALFWGLLACPTIEGALHTQKSGLSTYRCSRFNQWVFDQLDHIDHRIPVVIINRTSAYVVGLNETDRTDELPSIFFSREPVSKHDIAVHKEFTNALVTTSCELAKDRPVYLMRPVPEFGIDIPKKITRQLILGQPLSEITLDEATYRKRHALVLAAQDRAVQECGVHLLDPLPYLCKQGICYGTKEGKPLYYDDDHLNHEGGRLLMPLFESLFQRQELM